MDVPDILQQLVDDGAIDDVRARLMSGKEASVFVVERAGDLVAAKVYKDRDQRTFKATADYTEGRNQSRNSRDKRAMGKRTTHGRELAEASWRDMEFQALQSAFMSGVRVPEPYLLYDNVLLMELLVDESGAPAPRLADFRLDADVAALLHREIYGQVRLLLRSGYIHGDLSAFNILIAHNGPTLIDMPQVVDASTNNSAPAILQRDLQNVTEHLARFDARLLRFRDCGSALWQHYRRGEIDLHTEPEEGGVRRQDSRGHRGRRARDAERGRAGRAAPASQNNQHSDRPAPTSREQAPRATQQPQHRDDQRRDAQRRDEQRRDVPQRRDDMPPLNSAQARQQPQRRDDPRRDDP
ncbi:MAG TPA: RIO1 family regulatory kinase/ATPase, partial [Myxococcota bacterium]